MLKLTIDEYTKGSNDFENSLDDCCKKNNGIFYTDVRLAADILNELDIDADSTILDPCCGVGSFLYAAASLGCNNIYGADIINPAVKKCAELTQLRNVKCLDTIGKNGSDTLKALGLEGGADIVIGNPPYAPIEKDVYIDTDDLDFLESVRKSGNNLFVAAIYRAFELAGEDGYISYILPKNFLHVRSYSCLRRHILKSLSVVSIIDIGAYFPGVRGEQIILTMKNRFTDNNIIKIKRLSDSGFADCCTVPQAEYADEILLFKCAEEYSIYRKLRTEYPGLSDVCKYYIGRGRSVSKKAISGKDIRKFGFKNNRDVPQNGNRIFIQNIYSAESGIIAAFAGEYEASQTVTIFTESDEKNCRYILGILHSRLCNFYLLKFCYNSSKLTMHTDKKYLSKIPLVKDETSEGFSQLVDSVRTLEKLEYMSPEWFDKLDEMNEIVYRLYNINKQESEYIDNEMLLLQSKKWANIN